MTPQPLLPRRPGDFKPITTIHNHITIASPPIAVVTPLIDTTAWPSWNTFNPSAKIFHRPEPDASHPLASLFAYAECLAPGVKFAESHSEEARKMVKSMNENENIEIIAVEEIKTDDGKKGYRVIWRVLDWNGLLMRSRRIQEFVENESGGTEYDSWTELGGLFSYPLKWSSIDKKIGVLFDGAFKSLKEFVEGGGKVATK